MKPSQIGTRQYRNKGRRWLHLGFCWRLEREPFSIKSSLGAVGAVGLLLSSTSGMGRLYTNVDSRGSAVVEFINPALEEVVPPNRACKWASLNSLPSSERVALDGVPALLNLLLRSMYWNNCQRILLCFFWVASYRRLSLELIFIHNVKVLVQTNAYLCEGYLK